MSGPNVLILGGTGFIGKNLLAYIVEYKLAGKVRVADKTPPQMAYLDDRFAAAFAHESVEFVQVDLVLPKGREKAFDGQRWNVVVNLAFLSQFGRISAEYQLMTQMRVGCAKDAETLGCDKYVEVSTTTVYKPHDEKGSTPAKEDRKTDPRDDIASAHVRAEAAVLEACPTLPLVIVRLATVYGPGDIYGLMPRLTCAASYLATEEKKMDLLYSEELRIHTVHVQDAVGGIWYAACTGVSREAYNVVDKNDTTQKKLNKIIEELLPIKTSILGHNTTKAALLATNLESLLKDANEEHLDSWSTLLQQHQLKPGPLTTYLCKEQLSGFPNSADGSKIEALGYQVCRRPPFIFPIPSCLLCSSAVMIKP